LTSDDSVTVTTVVAADPRRTFALFTDDVDVWWRRGPRYRFGGAREGRMRFTGGRLVEELDGGEVYEVGRVSVWEPGARLVFGWRGRGFAPDETTEVEVRFEPVSGGTRVTVEHRGWARLAKDHPERHGLRGRAFVDMIGLWWADQATSLRQSLRMAEP
jgi:uncharacterized protein YndB with AHSA1/START domain